LSECSRDAPPLLPAGRALFGTGCAPKLIPAGTGSARRTAGRILAFARDASAVVFYS